MHPHWYAASPEVQRKLVSLFIISLDSKMRSPVTTLSPIPTSPSTLFSTELEYTRSPHDVAAVLRWAIRHVRLEGSSFGSKGQGEWGWYVDFATRERESGYPPNAFSQILVPQLPPAHLQLLTATLDIIASLAAHAETTGASGSKLAKLFGLWLLAQPRNKANEDWQEFYTRWEQSGRILEHLFLAHVRYVVSYPLALLTDALYSERILWLTGCPFVWRISSRNTHIAPSLFSKVGCLCCLDPLSRPVWMKRCLCTLTRSYRLPIPNHRVVTTHCVLFLRR